MDPLTNSGPYAESAGSTELASSQQDEAILTRLLTTYAIAVDERDWPVLQSIFASGARIDYSKSLGLTTRGLGPAPPLQRRVAPDEGAQDQDLYGPIAGCRMPATGAGTLKARRRRTLSIPRSGR